jgi:tetratricopeptide (TPR) repeat protein
VARRAVAVLPETSGILDLIGKYDPGLARQAIMDQVRDERSFPARPHFYNHAEFDKAIELFGKVGEASDFYVKAKFFEGVTYVRKYEGRPAGEAFKRVLEVARERPKQYKAGDLDRYEELAMLQMARVFYSTKDFDKAIRYYEKLPQNSGEWAESLFEASWAYFMKTSNPKALGNIHTLNAPYFENQFFPESILLKSVIYYKYCAYDRALEADSEFNTKFKPLRENLQGVVAKYEDNAEFYEYVKKIMAGKATADGVRQTLGRLRGYARITMSAADKRRPPRRRHQRHLEWSSGRRRAPSPAPNRAPGSRLRRLKIHRVLTPPEDQRGHTRS